MGTGKLVRNFATVADFARHSLKGDGRLFLCYISSKRVLRSINTLSNSRAVLRFIFPFKDHRFLVDGIDALVDAVNEFLFTFHPNVAQKGPGDFTEKQCYHIEPSAMLGRKYSKFWELDFHHTGQLETRIFLNQFRI